jgi:caa(3)-type oxidase subunit IV
MAEHTDDLDHSPSHYVKVWAVLLVLLVISVLGPIAAPHMEVGFLKAWHITILTAFGIAIVKAYLVAKNFMHLNIEKRYISYMLGTMLMFMLLFFAGTAPDVMKHKGKNWENVAAEAEVERALEAQAEEGDHGGAHDAEH